MHQDLSSSIKEYKKEYKDVESIVGNGKSIKSDKTEKTAIILVPR